MISQDRFHSDDDQLLDQAIADFLRAESSGEACDRQVWLDRYPSCAIGLIEFFEDRDRVKRIAAPVPADWLASSDPEGTEVIYASSSGASAKSSEGAPRPPQFTTTRYRPLNFHARGGMGEVWLANDEWIGRQVAVKKLRTGRDGRHARFICEAQITGQLEHPSIVPLHDLGIDDAGQPFFVMKFIEGRRLSEAIKQYHADKTLSDWPSDMEFRQLLQTFISICFAIAYAHDKGVLHRDIKPDNVMIGAYGETLVLDWGLAKVMGHSGPLEEGTSVRISAGESSTIQEGRFVGTPVYMSPEEAEGKAESIDQSSDVYLLGATLYEILTGRPPRQGSSLWELIDLARKSRPVNPRKLDPRIPRALEAICLRAMAFEKSDRYATAIALAQDVQRFLAGEPVVAYKEPFSTRAWRWVRRYRRSILRGLAIVCVLTLTGFANHSYRQARMLADREEARGRLHQFNQLADEAQFFAANADAMSERVPYYDPHRARSVGETALAAAAPWGQQAQRLPLAEHRMEFLQSEYALLLSMARVYLQTSQKTSGPREALALLDQAKTIQHPSRVYYQLRSRCLSLLGEHQRAQQELERANLPETPVTAVDHFVQGELLRSEDEGSLARAIDDEAVSSRDHLAKAVGEYRRSLELDPRHYWARFQLGRCLLALGRGPEAIETLSACVAIRPSSPWAYTARGLACGLSGRAEDALKDLDRAVQLDPGFQPARLNRGIVHWLLKNTDDAMSDFDGVLAVPAEQRLIEAAFYRGQLLMENSRSQEALVDFSTVIDAKPDFRPAYWQRARTWFDLKDYDHGQSDVAKFLALGQRGRKQDSAARVRFVNGRALRQMAAELDGDAQKQALVRAAVELQAAIAAGELTAEAFQHLGAAQELLGEVQKAVASYSQGLTLSADDVALRNLRGWTYLKKGQYELARTDFFEACRIAPDNPESHAGLGCVLAQVGSSDDAWMEALAALLVGADNHLILHNIACIYGRLSESATGNKIEHEDLALAALKRALTLSRQNTVEPGEAELIRQETWLPDSLQSRPEFKRLFRPAQDREQ